MTGSATRENPLVWRGTVPLARGALLREAAAIAARLPPGQHVVNLCEQREAFLLAFAACVLAERVQLMPAARGETALAELRAEYPGSATITDEGVQRLRAGASQTGIVPALLPADEDRLILIGFTSGSTGKSQAHAKRWRALANSARLNSAAIRAALGLAADASVSVLGTVPSHHMYGIELTVLLSLFAGMSVHADRPLFPADVAAALAQPARPRVLVSTPLHLRALAESGLAFPALDLIVSATAPLDPALARQIEERLRAPLLEMFGSTETCVIAHRRTTAETAWRLYPDIALKPQPDGTLVDAPYFEQPVVLQDIVELLPGHAFHLCGRNADLVEIAGKRASLADLTRRMLALPGVTDAIALQLDAEDGSGVRRIAALIVAPERSEAALLDELRLAVDPVFLPRPFRRVAALPRNETGKLARSAVLEALRG